MITTDSRYITLARRLILAVHNTLGYTRDLQARLPGATDDHPLQGGLRIGKLLPEDDESGQGDGQYFHYLTRWMPTLSRMTVTTGEPWYNNQAIELAQLALQKFKHNGDDGQPQLHWKMNINLNTPQVSPEGSIDPIDGYVTYRLLQDTAKDETVLQHEISILKTMLDRACERQPTDDPLDLGMLLWLTSHLHDQEGWAHTLSSKTINALHESRRRSYFDRPMAQRVAYREFGAALGLYCHSCGSPEHSKTAALAEHIVQAWEDVGVVASYGDGHTKEDGPITAVMYAAALLADAKKAMESKDNTGNPGGT